MTPLLTFLCYSLMCPLDPMDINKCLPKQKNRMGLVKEHLEHFDRSQMTNERIEIVFFLRKRQNCNCTKLKRF